MNLNTVSRTGVSPVGDKTTKKQTDEINMILG